MWYLSWALGVSFAIFLSVLNALWVEEKGMARHAGSAGDDGRAGHGI